MAEWLKGGQVEVGSSFELQGRAELEASKNKISQQTGSWKCRARNCGRFD